VDGKIFWNWTAGRGLKRATTTTGREVKIYILVGGTGKKASKAPIRMGTEEKSNMWGGKTSLYVLEIS